jgi:hypothetical protein
MVLHGGEPSLRLPHGRPPQTLEQTMDFTHAQLPSKEGKPGDDDIKEETHFSSNFPRLDITQVVRIGVVIAAVFIGKHWVAEDLEGIDVLPSHSDECVELRQVRRVPTSTEEELV